MAEPQFEANQPGTKTTRESSRKPPEEQKPKSQIEEEGRGSSMPGPCSGTAIEQRSDRAIERPSDRKATRVRGKRTATVYRDIPEDLKRLVEPVLDDLGCELVDVVVRRTAKDGLLRVVIDNASGDGRVSIDSIESASREIEVQLDAADYMTGRYRLEVSSPGLDRILAREKDFEAAVGERVQLQTRFAIEGRKRFKGKLVGFEGRSAAIEVDGQTVSIPFETIEKANTIYQFSRSDFSGAGE